MDMAVPEAGDDGLSSAVDDPRIGRDLDFVTTLAAIVNDIYVYQTDQVIDIGLQKKLYELRTMDNHPMHKLVKAGYLAK